METLDNKDELIQQLHSLKQHQGFLFLIQTLTNWKNQAAGEMAEMPFNDPKMSVAQAEYKAYGRLLKLPDQLMHDLTTETPQINFDPYK